jgi:DNA-binding transcriptional LysR family regulator
MELRHLRYFVAVAEELHFSRAAHRLRISQPPLSQQIAALEAELGLKLLERDKRNVSLTKAGEIFLNRARKILASADDAVDEARRVDRGYEGKIAIGFMSSIMLLRVGEFLAEFRAQSPNAEVSLRQLQSHTQYLAVIDGELDVGFVDISTGSLVNTLDATVLDITHALHERLVLCVAREHPLAKRKKVSMAELHSGQFITLTRQSFTSFFDTFLQLCQRAGFSPHIVQQVESMPVAVAMAAAGFGIAIVPALSQGAVEPESACFIPLDDEAYVDIYMISRIENKTGLVSRMRDICTKSVVQS